MKIVRVRAEDGGGGERRIVGVCMYVCCMYVCCMYVVCMYVVCMYVVCMYVCMYVCCMYVCCMYYLGVQRCMYVGMDGWTCVCTNV